MPRIEVEILPHQRLPHNESTPELQRLWRMIERAASRAPKETENAGR